VAVSTLIIEHIIEYVSSSARDITRADTESAHSS
jgi:hypothetical protein